MIRLDLMRCVCVVVVLCCLVVSVCLIWFMLWCGCGFVMVCVGVGVGGFVSRLCVGVVLLCYVLLRGLRCRVVCCVLV